MSKETYCDNVLCLTKTCSKHFCHCPLRWKPNVFFDHWGYDTCDMYQGPEKLESIFKEKDDEDYEV